MITNWKIANGPPNEYPTKKDDNPSVHAIQKATIEKPATIFPICQVIKILKTIPAIQIIASII